MGRTISVIVDDILEQPVQVIVVDWRASPLPWWISIPRGTPLLVRREAGAEPYRELAEQKTIPLGSAALTGPGRLRHYKGIVHAATLNAWGRATEESIRSATQSALRIAGDLNFRSVAFSVLGADRGIPERRAYEVLRDTLIEIETTIDVRIIRSPDRHD